MKFLERCKAQHEATMRLLLTMAMHAEYEGRIHDADECGRLAADHLARSMHIDEVLNPGRQV